jgi:hypothetical protein
LFVAQRDGFGDYNYIAQSCHNNVWSQILKKSADELTGSKMLKDSIKVLIRYERRWTIPYEFIEELYNLGILEELDVESEFTATLNKLLKENFSGYSLMDGRFIPITNEVEVQEIQTLSENLKRNKLHNVHKHLEMAIKLLSQKENTPYNKVIHSAISMVEATAIIIEPSAKTLADALKALKSKNFDLHSALNTAFEKLYGYTGDAHGIRHAHKFDEKENLDLEDARFFLIACSAFTNYLIVKAQKAGLLLY